MFLDFYKLREQPFGVTPDPRFLYQSRTHREALASLFYAVEAGRGFSALIAKPGMGKTTLLFRLIERLRKTACTAFLFQTQCNSREFLQYLLSDMGIETKEKDPVTLHEALNEALVRMMRAGTHFVLIIDEAQNLEESVLETVRLLSDFETPQSKLMQIILSGQPQLAAKLARPSLAQLRQRIGMLCRLDPLSPEEIAEYIDDRLRCAGYQGSPLFAEKAQAIIAERSEGIPRNVNNLCFNALSLGCALGRKTIDAEIVREVVADMDLDSLVIQENPVRQPAPSAPSMAPLAASGRPTPRESGWRNFRAAASVAFLVTASLFLFKPLRKPLNPGIRRFLAADTLAAPRMKTMHPPALTPAELPIFLTPQIKADISELAVGETPPLEDVLWVVKVEPRESLFEISLRYLGRFDRRLEQEILKLNPNMEDPNILGVGQLIRLPRPSQRPKGHGSSVDLAQGSQVAPGNHL